MTTDKLYRLMDILDDLKKIDSIISLHQSNSTDTSELMLSQYTSRRNQLLVYFINELNTSSDLEETPQRLYLIKQIIERFYNTLPENLANHDAHLDRLSAALAG